MKVLGNRSLALFTMLGLFVPAGSASAGDPQLSQFLKKQAATQIQNQFSGNQPGGNVTKKPINLGQVIQVNPGVVKPKLPLNPGVVIPVAPVNPGVVKPKFPIKPGIGPGINPGIVKPNFPINPNPVIPIDPGIGNGQGGNNNPQHPILDAILQQILNDLANNGGNGGVNGGGNGNNNGGNNGNGQNNQGNNNNGQTFARIDLELRDLKLVDLGDETMGPAYRLTIRNNSQRSVITPFVVVLMATHETQPTTDSPYNTAQVPQLAAGQSTTVDVRLPAVVAAQPEAFEFLTAAVGSPAGMFDQDNTNNQAAFQRSSVSEIPAKIVRVSVDETAGHMVLEGEGFGSKLGRVFLTVAGQKYQATVKAWGPAAVYFTIDGFHATTSDTASFTLVRNDGRLAPSLDVAIAN